jgi:superfamily II DNA or RNA helicase
MAASNYKEHDLLETIRVRKLSHSELQVDCDFGQAQELNEFFSFFVPGYKFMPAFRNKLWDGKIRLFNIRSNTLPAGLIDHLEKFSEQRGYAIDVEKTEYGYPDNSANIEKVDPQEIINFIHSINLPFEIRDYQFDAVCKALEKKRAILLSPTGSGKSLIIYVLLKYFLSMISDVNQKVLVVVPTTSLVEQMYNDFKDYGMLVENGCHRIYSGKDKDNINGSVVISTWQSIYKLSGAWFEQFGMVIGDECHGFKSKSLTSIMNKCTEAAYRFGTTGTLDGTQTHELVLQGLFGRVHKVTTTRTLQDNDTLAKLEIRRIVLEYKEDIGKLSYQDEIDYIVRYEKRNQFIRNLALDQKGNTLVLFQFVEKHGKILFDLIKDKAHDDRKVFFVSGATDTSDREAIRKITEKQKDAIIVASLGTFSTGINIRNLHNIIFASPSKSQIRVLQSIGRGLRKSDDGRVTQLYDITDDLSNGTTQQNFALLHSYERLKMYKAENFIYKTYKVEI